MPRKSAARSTSWESTQKGFDRKFPIEVRITDRLLPAASGKRVAARYILGDGSHRLACLMVMGYRTLPRDHYRIRFAFLSTVYGAPQACSDRDGFLCDIESRMPDRLDEVRAILRVDGFAEG